MTWWAVGVAVVSAGIGMYNADKTAERQDRNLAMQIKNQSKEQQGAESKIREMMDKLGQSNSKDEEKQRMDQYLDTLQRGSQANGINQGAGGFSDAYRKDAAAAEAGLQDFGVNRAGLLARTDAPGLQRVNEGILFDDTAFDIKGIGRNANQQQYLDNLALQAIRPDPWLDALSQIGGAYAGAAMGGGGKSKATPMAVEPEKIDLVF